MRRFFSALGEKLRSLRDAYHRRKYILIARLAGRGGAHDDLSKRGLLLIQIDALPYETLCSAMERGYLPFLRRELLRGNFHLRKWYSGIPSNTPSVQAALLYGNNDGIPGFRWYERDQDLHINFKNPLNVGVVENRLNTLYPGLLEGGSSYSNMFSGGASTSVATLGTFASVNIARRLRGLQIFMLVLTNFLTVLRTAYYTIKEFLIELNDWFYALRHGLIQRGEYLFPLYRILMNVWVREVITIGVLTDIARGTPSIYASYLAYDELAHQRGPLSKSALASLKTIDHRIRKIVRLARRRILREYDIFVFSDHGITASMPFFYLYGQTLDKYVAELVDDNVMAYQHEHTGESQVTYARILALRLEAYERELMHGARAIVKAFRRMLVRRIERDQEMRNQQRTEDDVIVAVSGPLAHIYLPGGERLDEARVTERYPRLIDGLVSHKGISVVITRRGDTVAIRSSEGSAIIDTHGFAIASEGDPLPGIEPKQPAFRDIRRLLDMHNAGDVVVLGTNTGRYTVNLEEQMGAHGGLGGLQNSAFLMYQPDAVPPGVMVDNIDSSRKLHQVFKAARNREEISRQQASVKHA